MIIIYFLLITNYVLLSRLYSNRKIDDNETKISALSCIILTLLFHSLLVIFEQFSGYDIGIQSFWKRDSDVPKSSYGYIFGAVFIVLYLLLFRIVKNKITFAKKIRIIRKIIQIRNLTLYAWIYVIAVIFLFVFTLYLAIKK